MANCEIRIATVDDVPRLVEFNCALALETEGKALDRELVTRGVTRAFDQGEEALYFVAEKVSAVIGSLMMTREWSDWRNGWIVWIQSVYVMPDHRGAGVFRALLTEATEFVKQNEDVVGLRLYVENDNHRAQSVYQRSGFDDPRYKVLEKLFEQ